MVLAMGFQRGPRWWWALAISGCASATPVPVEADAALGRWTAPPQRPAALKSDRGELTIIPEAPNSARDRVLAVGEGWTELRSRGRLVAFAYHGGRESETAVSSEALAANQDRIPVVTTEATSLARILSMLDEQTRQWFGVVPTAVRLAEPPSQLEQCRPIGSDPSAEKSRPSPLEKAFAACLGTSGAGSSHRLRVIAASGAEAPQICIGVGISDTVRACQLEAFSRWRTRNRLETVPLQIDFKAECGSFSQGQEVVNVPAWSAFPVPSPSGTSSTGCRTWLQRISA